MTTGQGAFTFHVIDLRRAGDPIPAALAPTSSSLTLVTAVGSGWRSGWAPTKVLSVDASLAGGKIAPTPAGRPTVAAAADLELAGDNGDLIVLVSLAAGDGLWYAAGLVYAYSKWSVWQLWLVGLPTVLAVLWGTTSAALLLLPNLA